MKTTQSLRKSATTALLMLAAALPLHAADLYWGSDTTADNTDPALSSWQDATHWFSDAAGTLAAPNAPAAGDNVFFSITSLNGTQLLPRLYAETTINAITFNNTITFDMQGGSANRLLHLGAGGLTLNGANVTLGTSTANRNILVRIQADQTWTNNSTGTLNIRNSAAASNNAAGNVVLTLRATSSGNLTNSGAFSDGTAGSLGIIVDSPGTGIANLQNSAYSGGTTVKQGILAIGGGSGGFTSIGSAGVAMDADGATAIIRNTTANSVTNTLTVNAQNAGVNQLEFSSTTAGGGWSGDILLNSSLNVATRANREISGDISGSGGIRKTQHANGNGILTLSGVNTYTGDTYLEFGNVTLAETGVLTFAIGSAGQNNKITGAGVSGLNLVLDGAFAFDLSAAGNTEGDTWTIVDHGNLSSVTYGSTFSVEDFADIGGNQWSKVANSAVYTFDGSAGTLSVSAIPEPSTFLLISAALLLRFIRRRRG